MFSLLLDSHGYATTPFTWPPLVVGILIAILGLAVLHREHLSPVSLSFFLLTSVTAIWLSSFGAIYSLENLAMVKTWAQIEHLGVMFLPSMVYAFVLAIIKQTHECRRSLAVCLILSSLFYGAMRLTPWFLVGFYNYRWGYYPHYGPLSFPFL